MRRDAVSTLTGHWVPINPPLVSPLPEPISLLQQPLLPCAKPCVRWKPMYDMTYELPAAAITNDHRCDGFKQRALILLQFWKSAAGYRGKVKGSAGQVPFGGCRENHFLPFTASRGSLSPLACCPFFSLQSETCNIFRPLCSVVTSPFPLSLPWPSCLPLQGHL